MSQCLCGSRAVAAGSAETHPYMVPEPGCWRAYNEFATRFLGLRLPHVDAYAAQHFEHTESDLRQRQSVAVHLTSLCLAVECNDQRVEMIRPRLSRIVLPALNMTEWPELRAPTETASMNIDDIEHSTRADVVSNVDAWRESVWNLWHHEHDTIKKFAQTARNLA